MYLALGSPTATPGNKSLTKQPHSTIEGVQSKAASPRAPSNRVGVLVSACGLVWPLEGLLLLRDGL